MIINFIKNKKNILFPLGLLLIAGVTYFRWLSFDVFSHSDYGFAYGEVTKQFLTITSWYSLGGMGAVDILLWRMPINLLEGLFGYLGYGTNVSEKFVVFWPSIVVGNLTVYYMVRKITKSEVGGFVAALIFNYNTYYFVSSPAFLLYSAAAYATLGVWIYISAQDQKKLYLAVLSALVLFIAGSYDLRVLYLGVGVIFLYFVFEFLRTGSGYINLFKKNIIYLGVVLALLFLSNIYWIVTMLSAKSLVSNTILSRGLFGGEFLNILYAISFQHPYWTGAAAAIFESQAIKTYFWLFPFAAFLGLFLLRKNKHILFFGLVTLIGIFLTKQTGHPFPSVYEFFFKHVPGFNAFREAGKFYYLIALGYAVLIGGFSSWVFSQKMKGLKQYLGIAIVVGIIATTIFNLSQVVSGNLKDLYVKKEIPKDYLVFKDFISNKNEFSRILWIPTYSRWGTAFNNHPIIDGIARIGNEWSPIVKDSLDPTKVYQGELLPILLKKDIGQRLISLSSIKYVVVPLEDKKNGDNFYVFYGKPRDYYLKELDKISSLERVKTNASDLVIYLNKTYRPHIYSTIQKDTIKKDIPYKPVNFQMINPSHYVIQIKAVKEPFFLNFSDDYHPKWSIRIGEFAWYNVILQKNYFVDNKEHSKNDALLNSFYISPDDLCSKFSCTKNSDGTYDISMTLYFPPQSYLYLGLIISVATLIIACGYLLIFFLKTHEKTK